MSIRVLAMIACPADVPPFDAEGEWRALRQGLEPLIQTGAVTLMRLDDATENDLCRRLAENEWDVIHFIGRGRVQGARYATLILEGQGNRSRAITARHFGELLRKQDNPRLVVLQACAGEDGGFREAAGLLVDEGFGAVVTAAPVSPDAAAEFVRRFYTGLAAGAALGECVARAGADVGLFGGKEIFAASAAIDSSGGMLAGVAHAGGAGIAARMAEAALEAEAIACRREIEQRRAAGHFDVFLCHNSSDKPAVKGIGRQLMERGILPWLDEWELRPGMPWQRLLEDQITGIRAAAVFVGPDGLGPWQRQELDSFLRQFVSGSCPVIPVLLNNAPIEPKLPLFLQGMTWVDFRDPSVDAIGRLIWGITGQRVPLG
jgi:hypothetical protein